MSWHPVSDRTAPRKEAEQPRAALRFVALCALLPFAFFVVLRSLGRIVPEPPSVVVSLRLGDAEWFIVATILGVSIAVLMVVLGGRTDPHGGRRPIGRARVLLTSACVLAPSALLVGQSLRYGLSLTPSEFQYRPLLSFEYKTYPYSAVRRVELVPGTPGVDGGHLRIEFQDGYRFSTRRFRASVAPADVASIARYVSAREAAAALPHMP